jgi:hypothetical protein
LPLTAEFLRVFLFAYSGGGTESEYAINSLDELTTLSHHVGVRFDGVTSTYKLRKVVHSSGSLAATSMRASLGASQSVMSQSIDQSLRSLVSYCSSMSVGASVSNVTTQVLGNTGPTNQVDFKRIEGDLKNAIGIAHFVGPSHREDEYGRLTVNLTRTFAGIEASGIRLNAWVRDLYDFDYATDFPPEAYRQFYGIELPNVLVFKPADFQANYRNRGDPGGVYLNLINLSVSVRQRPS